jgi:hypothetical protein
VNAMAKITRVELSRYADGYMYIAIKRKKRREKRYINVGKKSIERLLKVIKDIVVERIFIDVSFTAIIWNLEHCPDNNDYKILVG